MNKRKLSSLLAVSLSLELMVSPIIPHVHAQPTNRGSDAETKAAKVINSTAEAIGVSIQAAGQIWREVNPAAGNPYAGMTPQMAGDMQKFKEQMTPQPDKYFNPQKLMQIPGLANYLAINNINPASLDCKSLPTTLHDARPEVCRVGVTGDKGLPPQQQLSQMFTYYNQYFQVSKMYKNFSADSNADGQSFGIGCMKNAMNVLNGFFKYRMDELDKLTTNLEAMQAQFKNASRSDLDAIEEATAVLDGDSQLADKVRSKKPDLFDFGKRFNNPACNSMFAGTKLNDMGRAGGLNEINSDLKKTLTAKNGKYSGESYSKSHTAVVEDLNSLADKVSKQLELNFGLLSSSPESYGKFLSELPDLVSSPNGSNRVLTPDLFSDVRTKFNDNFMKLNETKATIMSELSEAKVSPDSATRLLGNPVSQNFDSEVASIENRLKNKCFDDTLRSIDKDKLMDKIYDPSASNHANKYASNFLKDKLSKIITNENTSLEKKLQELQALDAQNGGRYYMKMENSYEVQELDDQGNLKSTIVGASTVRTPSVFFTDLIKNCNAQFKANKLNNKLSGASAIQKLRQLNQDYKKLASSQAADMRKEVRKKLIECSSPEEANNTVPGSCTPEKFNTAAPGFCANAAFTCSKNMQACTEQADKYVKEIKEQRTARVNNYKSLLEKNKQDIVKIFDSALARYMKDGEALRGMFGAGFSSPAGIKREIDHGNPNKYLNEFTEATGRSPDGRLLLENPDEYVKMFKENIAALKESVKKQQDQILGGEQVGKNGGLLADHIQKTERNYKAVISEADRQGADCQSKHDSSVAAQEQQRNKQMEEQQKKNTELGEKRQEWCDKFAMAQENPVGACSGSAKDTWDAMKAVNTPEAKQAMSQFSSLCRQYNNTSESSGGSISFEKACLDVGATIGGTTNAKAPYSKREDAQSVLAACNKAESISCTETTTEKGTVIKSPECKAKERAENVAISLYSSMLGSKQQTGSLTLQDVDAGAVCAASSNSSSRFSKAISTFGNTFAQETGQRAGRQ